MHMITAFSLTQWQRMIHNQTDTQVHLGEPATYSRGMKIPKKLERWAIDIARPHLLTNKPSALTVDTTDPRSARRIYDEDEIMEDTDSTDKKLPAKDNWTPVQGKTKPRTITNEEARDTPLPVLPSRNPTRPSSESAIQMTQTPSIVHPNASQQNQAPKKGLSFVKVNDGTLRVAVRWKPDNYNSISEDDEQWNLAATDTIHYILETVSDAILSVEERIYHTTHTLLNLHQTTSYSFSHLKSPRSSPSKCTSLASVFAKHGCRNMDW
ncbi:hypothetical protein MHU86_15092 [Fragilaria crotonensis]|nr:hypothetical protein MHU86_15092 [Fragilaria crotonensis]